MRIVLLTAGVRGIGTYCMNLYNELTSHNHEVLLISERKWEKAPIDSLYQAKSFMLFGMAPVVYKPGEIVRAIQHFKPDLIHYHWPCGTMDFFFRWIEALGIPVLVTIHVSLASRKNILDRLWYTLFSISKKWISRVDMVNCISGFIKSQLDERLPLPDDRVSQVYAGVDEHVFTPCPKLDGKAINILFIGQIMPEKGIDVLVKAVLNVEQERDIKLTIVGHGPLEKQLHHISRNHRSIRWVGFLKDQKEIADYYGRSDVTVMPTRWDEAFSLVPLESLACGTPVIATAKGGTPEIISHGKTGYLLEDCDIDELTDLLLRLDRESLHSMGGACRTVVLERHTMGMHNGPGPTVLRCKAGATGAVGVHTLRSGTMRFPTCAGS